MSRFEKIIDLYFKEEGDFYLGDNGDLADTKNDLYRGFLQRVDTRMRSGKGDWSAQSQLGAGISDFLGKKNNEATARALKSRIYTELYQDDLLRATELTVDILPITSTAIVIALIIKPPASTGQVVIVYSYDLRDNKLMLRNI